MPVFPRLHLPEETATVEELFSYLQGIMALKGRVGGFKAGQFIVALALTESGAYSVSVFRSLQKGPSLSQLFLVGPNKLSVLYAGEPLARDTVGFCAWFITAHLSAHLISCYFQRQAARVA